MLKDNFKQILLRLKGQLNVSTNKAIADMLGMTYGAFNARGQRGSFPVEKLLLLNEREPGLQLDVEYILKGTSAKRGMDYAEAGQPRQHKKAEVEISERDNSAYVSNTSELSKLLSNGEFDAARMVDDMLQEIGFTQASSLLRSKMVELLRFGQITPQAAQVLLIVAKADCVPRSS